MILTPEYKKIIIPWGPEFKPYFYCNGAAIKFVEKCFGLLQCEYTIDKDESVQFMHAEELIPYKVTVDNPRIIGRMKKLKYYNSNLHYNNHCLYEGNIDYLIRHSVDLDLGVWLQFDLKNKKISNWANHNDIKLRSLYADLETDDEEILDKIKDRKILCFSYGEDEDHIYNFSGTEKEIMLKWKELVEQYDRVYFWNGDNFDEPILREAAKRNEVHINWKKINFVDQAFVINKTNPKYTGRFGLPLTEVAERECGVKKKNLPEGITKTYYNNFDLLVEYNNWDVYLQIIVEKVTGNLANWDYCAQFINIPEDKIKNVSRIPLVRLLRRLYHKSKIRKVLPNSRKDYDAPTFKGGSVTEDAPYKVCNNVFAMDIKGSYVGIIMTYGHQHPGTLLDYISQDIHEITAERNKIKHLRSQFGLGTTEYKRYHTMQYGIKYASLYYWGELGRKMSSMYEYKSAEFITTMGRIHIHRAEQKLEELLPVIKRYRDTDSVYWEFAFQMKYTFENVKAIMSNAINLINTDFRQFLTARGISKEYQFVEMEAQGFYTRVLWAGIAKHYMYYLKWNADTNEWFDIPRLGIKGWVKYNKGRLALECQHLAGRLLLDGVSVDDIIEYLKLIKQDVMLHKFDEDLVMKVGLTKKLTDYKSVGFVVKAARRAFKEGKYQQGFTFYYIIISDLKGDKTAEAVYEGKIPEIHPSGLRYMWNHYILTNVAAILKAEGIDETFINNRISAVNTHKFW